jgi:hypothetical protein
MTRAQLLTAAVLVVCGCTESSVGPGSSGGGTPPPPPPPNLGLTVITGTVSTDGSASPVAVSLQLESGAVVALVGGEAQRLGVLDGAEVELRGAWTVVDARHLETDDAIDPVIPTFEVDRFQVLVVGGRAAIDGMLAEEDGTYYVELLDGDLVWLDSAPSDFQACLGKRVWVTGSMDDPPFMIGVID